MNYKKLKEIIVEANPEIMKQEILYRCNRVWEAWQVKTMSEEDFEKVDLSEIITLADVLLAIDKTDITKCEQYKKENWTMPEFAGYIVIKLVNLWNLKDNNLENQSDECKQFLTDLLTKP